MSAVDAVRRLADESADAAGLVLEGVDGAGRRAAPHGAGGRRPAGDGDRRRPIDAVARCRSCSPSGSTPATPMGGRALRPRGDLARGRPAADRAPALGGAPPAGWSRRARATAAR